MTEIQKGLPVSQVRLSIHFMPVMVQSQSHLMTHWSQNDTKYYGCADISLNEAGGQ